MILSAIMPRAWPWLSLGLAALVLLQQHRIDGRDVDLAQLRESHAKTLQTQAEQAQAAIEKKPVRCWGTLASNRKTPMTTRKKSPLWKLPALLTLTALTACSTTSAPPPPPTPKLQAMPLPAPILQIDTSTSAPLLQRARQWLTDLSTWSNGETRK